MDDNRDVSRPGSQVGGHGDVPPETDDDVGPACLQHLTSTSHGPNQACGHPDQIDRNPAGQWHGGNHVDLQPGVGNDSPLQPLGGPDARHLIDLRDRCQLLCGRDEW